MFEKTKKFMWYMTPITENPKFTPWGAAAKATLDFKIVFTHHTAIKIKRATFKRCETMHLSKLRTLASCALFKRTITVSYDKHC
jgi:hypothetical protein